MADEIDHIEELQKRLYARDPESVPKQKFGILRPVKQNVASVWGQKKLPKEKSRRTINVSGYKRFFIFSLFFFLLAAGLALYSVFRGAVTLSGRNVEISILGNSFVAAGEELPIQIEIANKNSSDLVDVALTLDYPKGATDEAGSEVAHLVQTLGTIPSGKTKSVAFSVVLYGEQGSVRDIKATLSYHLLNSTATFEKKQDYAVLINSSPITLTVDGPVVTAADQSFTLTIRSTFAGDQPITGDIIRVEYPAGYTFQSAIPVPSVGNNVWSLGTFEKGQEKVVTIKGRLSGLEQDEKSFRIYLGTPVSETDNRIAVAYNSVLHTLAIEQPFISGDIAIGSESFDIVALPIGSNVSGLVSWRNNTGITLTEPVFTLILNGTSINPSSITADNSYYNPLDHTLTWNTNSNPDIASIEPGEVGQFPFNFSPQLSDHSDINLSLSVQATLPEQQNEIKTIKGLDETTIRFAARLQFAAQATYSVGPIKNTGPFPPKANEETSYTLTWTVRPTDNPLSNVIAKATLPIGISWAGVVAPQAEAINYSPDTRTVTWNAGSLPKATNIPLSKSVSFQVKVRPTVTQVGAELSLLSETVITATDATANVPLSATRLPLSTRLDTDPVYSTGSGKVVP